MNRYTLLLTTILTGLPSLAHADAYFDLHIPASACRPVLEDIDKLKLEDGAWVFDDGEFGTANLFCPLHLAAPWDLWYSTSIAEMRLWYQDPDATDNDSRVTATLKRREFDDSVDSSLGSIDSNNNNSSGFTRFNTSITHTANFITYSYHVEIFMLRRTTEDDSPVFVGIDFQPPPTL